MIQMANSLTFSIPGRAKPCVRTTQKQKWVDKNYKEYEVYKSRIKENALGAMLQERVSQITDPVGITASVFIKGKNRGDIDNYCKSILDGIQATKRNPQGLIKNDRQVESIAVDLFSVEKEEDQRVEVTLWW